MRAKRTALVTTGSSERAFGGLLSGSLTPILGRRYRMHLAAQSNSLIISYYGEQWRLGASGRADKLDFQYSVDATSLTTGSWTDLDALDFTAALNQQGRLVRLMAIWLQTALWFPATVSALSIADGATIWIRWNDFNATGADDGLAIDDFQSLPKKARRLFRNLHLPSLVCCWRCLSGAWSSLFAESETSLSEFLCFVGERVQL